MSEKDIHGNNYNAHPETARNKWFNYSDAYIDKDGENQPVADYQEQFAQSRKQRPRRVRLKGRHETRKQQGHVSGSSRNRTVRRHGYARVSQQRGARVEQIESGP